HISFSSVFSLYNTTSVRRCLIPVWSPRRATFACRLLHCGLEPPQGGTPSVGHSRRSGVRGETKISCPGRGGDSCHRCRPAAKTLTSAMPLANPPTCAHQATPPAEGTPSVASPEDSCRNTHTGRNSTAGTHTNLTNTNNSQTSTCTRAPGYSSRYAPRTPAIAPLAPIAGSVDRGLARTWTMFAITPQRR